MQQVQLLNGCLRNNLERFTMHPPTQEQMAAGFRGLGRAGAALRNKANPNAWTSMEKRLNWQKNASGFWLPFGWS